MINFALVLPGLINLTHSRFIETLTACLSATTYPSQLPGYRMNRDAATGTTDFSTALTLSAPVPYATGLAGLPPSLESSSDGAARSGNHGDGRNRFRFRPGPLRPPAGRATAPSTHRKLLMPTVMLRRNDASDLVFYVAK